MSEQVSILSRLTKSNTAACLILALALAIRWFTVGLYGSRLNLHSDDARYVQSAKWLFSNGTFSYYAPHVPTVHMMPGIVLLLAGVFALFGSGGVGLIVCKLLMSLIAVVGIWGVYLIGKRLGHPMIGLFGALFAAFYVPGILTSTLLLTETPFSTSLIYLLYFSIRSADYHKWNQVSLAALFYVICLYFRPTIALFPVLLLIYFTLRKYPKHLLTRHISLATIIIVAGMAPWWIRNALTFHHFIAMTDGTGNPLLLGTYQGIDYPNQYGIQQSLNRLISVNTSLVPTDLHEQQWMSLQTHLAVQRIHLWWASHPLQLLISYLWWKPKFLWTDSFYWIPLYHISIGAMDAVQPWLVVLSAIGWGAALVPDPNRHREAPLEVWLVILTLMYFTAISSVYFAFGRYVEPVMPLCMLGIGLGISRLLMHFKNPFMNAKSSNLFS